MLWRCQALEGPDVELKVRKGWLLEVDNEKDMT